MGFKDDIALSKADIGAGVALGVGAVALSADLMGAGVTFKLGVGVVAFGTDLVAVVGLGVNGADLLALMIFARSSKEGTEP